MRKHLTIEKNRQPAVRWALWLGGLLLLSGCDPAGQSQDKQLEKALDTQLELLHQTREVLQYTEDQEQLRQQQMQELGIDIHSER